MIEVSFETISNFLIAEFLASHYLEWSNQSQIIKYLRTKVKFKVW